jgi:hypothetical protein
MTPIPPASDTAPSVAPWGKLEELGVLIAFPEAPEEPEKLGKEDCHPCTEEIINEINFEGYLLDRCRYDVKCLIAAQDAFFRYPPDSEQRGLILESERYIRNRFLALHPLGSCRVLPGETARKAKARNVEEAQSAFRYSVVTYRDWYREIYLFSEHWHQLRRGALSANGDGTCADCGKMPKSLHVHHEEYRSIFDVTIQDLACLCSKCHKERHESGVLA